MITKFLILLSLIAFCASASVGKDEMLTSKVQKVSDVVQTEQLAEETAPQQAPRLKREPCGAYCRDTDKTYTFNNHYNYPMPQGGINNHYTMPQQSAIYFPQFGK